MHQDPIVATTAITVVAGVICQAIGRRFRVPSIVPLLAFGMILGPSGMGLVRPAVLGDGLRVLVGFAVAIILFEGGLSLKTDAFRFAGKAIRNLVVGGAAVTWLLASLAAALLFPELGIGGAVLYGSLVIVTGPTVIAPLLKSVRPRTRIADVLRGEAILVDPVGAFLAVLVLEFLLSGGNEPGEVLLGFGSRIGLGALVGGLGALLLDGLLRRLQVMAPDMKNLAVLAGAIGLYALSEGLIHESGVLTVTLAGFILGWRHPPGIEEIEEFKSHMTVLMVSMVFILLAANLSLEALQALGGAGFALIAILIFVVRPAAVFASCSMTELSLKEKAFISWIAPRGIVAAAVSSLFAILLTKSGRSEGELVMTLVFATIVGTVLVAGLTARIVGRWLGVLEQAPNGFLVIGANQVGRPIARALQDAGARVLVVDTNPWRVERGQDSGLRARHANALDDVVMDELDTDGLGQLLALTPNDSVNRLALRLYARDYGPTRVRALKQQSSPALTADAPPWLFGDRLTFEELDRRLDAGHTIESARVDHSMSSDALHEIHPGAISLLLLAADGSARFLDDEGTRLVAGETLLYLAPPESDAHAPPAEPRPKPE